MFFDRFNLFGQFLEFFLRRGYYFGFCPRDKVFILELALDGSQSIFDLLFLLFEPFAFGGGIDKIMHKNQYLNQQRRGCVMWFLNLCLNNELI